VGLIAVDRFAQRELNIEGFRRKIARFRPFMAVNGAISRAGPWFRHAGHGLRAITAMALWPLMA
jgi:hypothetical protein